MEASRENPIYTVYLVVGSKKYNLTPATTEIDLTNQENQIAQSASIDVANVRLPEGKTLCQILKVRQRVFIYANDGTTKAEVFRGWTWSKYHESDLEGALLTVKCYDNLIYLQESEDSLYFSKGKNTKSVMETICKNWGIKLDYSYSTITHGKLVLRGALTNIFMTDILDVVKARKGEKYVILSQKDVMYVKPCGSNKKIYQITKKNNASNVRAEETMDGMVTKVKILGDAGKNSEKLPVVATVKGDTAKYGTLQKLQDKDKDTSLADAKKEAETTIKTYGKPEKEYLVSATDIPWINKGDMVYVDAGHITGKNLIAVGVERTISNQKKTMTLTLKEPKEATVKTKSSTSSSAASGSAQDLLDTAAEMFSEMTKRGFKYNAANHLADSWSGAKKKKVSNCATYVSWAMQEAGIIPKGGWFWLGGKKVHYRSGMKRSDLTKNCTISYPNKSPKSANLQPGDVCGYTNHTQIFAGWDSKGNALWYSFGPSDVGKHLPRKRGNYNNRKIEVLIRLK